jgi:hypothetical protein
VDEKILLRTLPPPVGEAAINPDYGSHRGAHRFFRPCFFFAKFPSVFDVLGASKYQRGMIRLAKTLVHPRKGQADQLFEHLAPEGLEEERERALDEAFMEILTRNLPTVEERSEWAARLDREAR